MESSLDLTGLCLVCACCQCQSCYTSVHVCVCAGVCGGSVYLRVRVCVCACVRACVIFLRTVARCVAASLHAEHCRYRDTVRDFRRLRVLQEHFP